VQGKVAEIFPSGSKFTWASTRTESRENSRHTSIGGGLGKWIRERKEEEWESPGRSVPSLKASIRKKNQG